MAEERKSPAKAESQPIAFGRRLAGSEAFRAMFKEGMALVEETASYLDGDGRVESRRLTRAGSLAYATESMRLTTRLMQLASWLLLQRAVNDGEMSAEQAHNEKAKVKLQERVRKLDGAMENTAPGAIDNPVISQLGRLAREFSK